MGTVNKVFACLGYVYQVAVLAVGYGGYDEALIQSHGDADVEVGAGDEMVVLKVGVDVGIFLGWPWRMP